MRNGWAKRAACAGGLVLSCAAAVAAQSGEPSLGGLFGGHSVQASPFAYLDAAIAQLAARPLADVARKALDTARRALAVLQTERANPERVEQQRGLVWAALSLADRQIARAELEASLRALAARAEQTEVEARTAIAAQRAAEAALAQAKREASEQRNEHVRQSSQNEAGSNTNSAASGQPPRPPGNTPALRGARSAER